MTEYALAPNRKFDVANSPYRTPRVMLEQGLLEAYRVRSNGTMRHIDLVPLGSTARETAEYVSDRVEMDGASVQAVARELHVSTATVRRFLETLELTEEIEAGDWDDLIFDSQGMPVFSTPFGEDEEAAEATRVCAHCRKSMVISAEQAEGALGFEDMCVPCYELAGWENTHSDQHGATVRDTNCPLCQEPPQAETPAPVAPQPTAAPVRRSRRAARPVRTTEEIIRGQGLPYPTDEERAAALAGVGAQTAAAAPQAAPAPAAGHRAPIAVCFCGGLGQHAPGAMPTCKFAGSGAALLRKPRSHG